MERLQSTTERRLPLEKQQLFQIEADHARGGLDFRGTNFAQS
jgi:hypothetical protein